ncbi:15674_t:CDS:2, partial [Cetraspora pellucida]
ISFDRIFNISINDVEEEFKSLDLIYNNDVSKKDYDYSEICNINNELEDVDFTGEKYPSDNRYSMEIPEDYDDFYSNEYYMKIKCVATNGLDAEILISGFPVYCEFKISDVINETDN